MTIPEDHAGHLAPRRDFLQQLLAAGALVASGSALTGALPLATAAASPVRVAPADAHVHGAPEWDMSWVAKLGRYRTAYDAPEVDSGAALSYAASAADGYRQARNATPGEFTPVLVLRHRASVMVLDDAMWNRMALGEKHELKDPTSGEPARRNPFINYRDGDRFSVTGSVAGLDTLMAAGAIVLTCNRALGGLAFQLARQEPKLSTDQAHAEIRRHVLPGVYVMPNGIFAVAAAQDAGCNYMRVLA